VNSKEQHIYSLLDDIEGADSSGSEFMDEITDISLSNELDRTSSIPFHFGDRSSEVLQGLSHELDKTSGMPFLFEDRSPEGFEINHIDNKAKPTSTSSSNWYMKELRSDISKYLTAKLTRKLNLPGVNIPWSKLKAQDFINWPADMKFQPLYQMSTNNLRRLLKLVKEDSIDFSPEFISCFKVSRISKLRSHVAKYLAAKLSKESNRPVGNIRWVNIKAGDIINWPSDIKFRPVDKMGVNEVMRLYKLAKADLLGFTPEFVSRSQITRTQAVKSNLSKYLVTKLSRKLNRPINNIRWSIIKAGDILNWPQDIKLGNIRSMKLDEVERLYQLAKEDLLDFSPQLISRLKRPHIYELRSSITKYLATKLARKLHVSSITIRWSEVKAEDIINWPPDIEFKRIYEMGPTNLNRLYQLAKEDLLDFSPEFMSRFKIIKDHNLITLQNIVR
jgi:hypothetical protein